MAYSDEICKLVIENIDLLEEAPKVIDEIESKIFKEINIRFKLYFDGKEGWKDNGEYTFLDDGGKTVFAPIGWPEDEDTTYYAYYGIGNLGGDNEYWLTPLISKASTDKLGIFFNVVSNAIGMKKNQWKIFLMNQYQSKPILQELGVICEGLSLCLPISIDPKLMAEEYPELDACLKPVDDALDILMKVNPYIDEIVKEALRADRSS
jgi:hypothetical protein